MQGKLSHQYRSFTTWHQNNPVHLVEKKKTIKKKKLAEEKRSQDKGKDCFHDVGGEGANAESLASLSVCFRKGLK